MPDSTETQSMHAPGQNTNLQFEIVDHDMARVLAVKTPRERLEIAWGMWRSARRMLTNILSSEHPDWTDAEISVEVARRLASGG